MPVLWARADSPLFPSGPAAGGRFRLFGGPAARPPVRVILAVLAGLMAVAVALAGCGSSAPPAPAEPPPVTSPEAAAPTTSATPERTPAPAQTAAPVVSPTPASPAAAPEPTAVSTRTPTAASPSPTPTAKPAPRAPQRAAATPEPTATSTREPTAESPSPTPEAGPAPRATEPAAASSLAPGARGTVEDDSPSGGWKDTDPDPPPQGPKGTGDDAPPQGPRGTEEPPSSPKRSAEAEGAVYTWQDGDRTRRVLLQTDLVVDSDGTVVRSGSRDAQGKTQPVFVSESSGELMTLPGGVVLVFESSWSGDGIDAFFSEQGIDSSRIQEQTFTTNAFFVETEAGFPSLDLANALAGEEGVLLASPNWQREVSLR